MLNTVNNEYVLETFIDNFKKRQKMLPVDFYNSLEYNLKDSSVKLYYLFEDKSFIRYVIEMGLFSENDFLVESCANFLLTLQRIFISKPKDNLNLEILENISTSMISVFNKINRIESFAIFNDKVKL